MISKSERDRIQKQLPDIANLSELMTVVCLATMKYLDGAGPGTTINVTDIKDAMGALEMSKELIWQNLGVPTVTATNRITGNLFQDFVRRHNIGG